MELKRFKELIHQRCGLVFEDIGEAPLADGLRKRIAAHGLINAAAYYNMLKRDECEFYELISLLTINETYFFREPEQLHFVIDTLIPRMLERKNGAGSLRILSAGCSSGEELVSIAIALHEKYGPEVAHQFWLAGGDIDKTALHKACTAHYSQFSFRALPSELRLRYFDQIDAKTWRVKDTIRNPMYFHHLNLVAENYPLMFRQFDLIFFRNVSIYFDRPVRQAVQQNLAALLNEHGCLVVGTAETMANDLGVLKLVTDDAMCYLTKHDTRHTTTLSLAPVTVCMPDQPAPSPSPRSHVMPAYTLNEVIQSIQEARYDAALELLSLLETQQQNHTVLVLLKAFIRLQCKEYEEADHLAQQILDVNPWSIDALMVLGLSAKWRGIGDVAIKHFKQIIYACQTCWPAHYYLAELYRTAQQTGQARRAYRITLHLLSEPDAARDGLAVVPLSLPSAQVRFLCEHQLAKLNDRLEPSET